MAGWLRPWQVRRLCCSPACLPACLPGAGSEPRRASILIQGYMPVLCSVHADCAAGKGGVQESSWQLAVMLQGNVHEAYSLLYKPMKFDYRLSVSCRACMAMGM